MNRSPTQRTSKLRSNSIKYSPAHSNPVNNSSSANSNTLYFCHYKNAMYMGGIKSFKKQGKGILIHDCGLSIVTSYLNDLMHGHNVFFSQHCLLSAEFVKGKLVEAAYRTDGFLGYFHFNNDGQLQGKCKLLNYTNKSITYASFRKGIMFQKDEQLDFNLLNRVFDLGDYDFLIGRTHFKALKYDLQKINNIEGQKYGNKMTIGFQKGGMVNGLGFTIVFRGSHGGYNPDTHRNEDQFELRVIERGQMFNSQLNGFGEKWFKNGNLYIGQFKNGIFQGNGILRNTAKKNWVSGYFQKGNLIDLLQYNNQGEEKKYDRIVQALHERKTNWINNQIILPDMQLFDVHLERIVTSIPTSTVKSLEQRKQEVLRKIQDNFICEPNSLPSFLESANKNLKQIQNQRQGEKESVKKFVNSFIPDIIKKDKATDQNTQILNVSKLGSSRRALGNIRKSKIFEKTSSSDHYLRIQDQRSSRKVSRTPETKKKIFSQTSTGFKPPQLKFNEKDEHFSNDPQGSHDLNSSSQVEDGKGWGALGESSIGPPPSQGSHSNHSHDNKQKKAGKSKIFKYLQNQTQQISPQFTYTKVQTLRESEKRKRLGIQDSA